MLGQLLAFDKHMNLVLTDCEEFRLTKKQKQAKPDASSAGLGGMRRTLGMLVLRGETIVSLIPESGPPPAGGNKARVPAARQMAPPTMAGRPPMGMPGMVPPPGAPLAGPVPGMYGVPPPMYPSGMMPSPGMPGMPYGYPQPPPGAYPPPPPPPQQ
jgi:small nuclear ribonucleoprotein B and B'